MDELQHGQLLNKYREIEGDIVGLLNSFSPGDSSALILDKISHLKQTLVELQDAYETGSVEHTSIANQYGQTLRAAMDKGIDITPEREIQAGVDFVPGVETDPLSEAEYQMAQRQQKRRLQQARTGTKTDYTIDPVRPDVRILDFGIKRARNGLGGVRKIHFNHRPPTVFDDVWYGDNEAAMDAMLGPKTADEMMVMTHLALHDNVEQPVSPQQEQESLISISHDEENALQNNLGNIVANQQKRADTIPQSLTHPSLNFPRF